jgi:3-deoxy-D-manno-octulosonate 8-phosphate phosphatase (KDO 8-P phosphatase)
MATDYTKPPGARDDGRRQPALYRTSGLLLASLNTRLQRVRWLLCDVDGVLTDGTVLVGENFEAKRFDIQDGLGQALLRRAGIKVGWVSNRPSAATAARAAELKVDFLHQDPGSKVAAIEALLAQANATWEEVCYIGDDIVDLGALKRAGLAVTVANGVAEAKAVAHCVSVASGGGGAVREVAELILKAQGRWAELVAGYEA